MKSLLVNHVLHGGIVVSSLCESGKLGCGSWRAPLAIFAHTKRAAAPVIRMCVNCVKSSTRLARFLYRCTLQQHACVCLLSFLGAV